MKPIWVLSMRSVTRWPASSKPTLTLPRMGMDSGSAPFRMCLRTPVTQ
jgi:hypothetical protein